MYSTVRLRVLLQVQPASAIRRNCCSVHQRKSNRLCAQVTQQWIENQKNVSRLVKQHRIMSTTQGKVANSNPVNKSLQSCAQTAAGSTKEQKKNR